MRRLLIAIFVLTLLVMALVPPAPAAASRLPAQSRPVLSGEERTYGTANFLIHYTFIGIDAVPGADTDSSGTSDWVEEVGRVMEVNWQIQINEMGWPAPLPDRGEGGDARFDVYLMELFSRNLAGYVSPDGGFVGDNPATPRTEQQAAYGYLVLENDYYDPNPPAGLRVWPPEDWLRIISAHEFNHMLQIAINGIHPMHFWYEATANWMESQVFPHLADNLNSADAVFKSPDTCMLRYGGVNRIESGLHWYGMWVFDQMLSETYGPEMVLDIWHRMADGYGYVPFDDAFAARGTTFDRELERFAASVLLRAFAEGDRYPTARLQEEVSGPGEWNPVDGVQRYAMDYIGLNLSGTYTISTTSEDPGVKGMVVGVRGTQADVYPSGAQITVDFDDYERAFLVVLNFTRPATEAGCATARYTYSVSDPVAQPAAVAYNVSAPYFAEPRVEAVTDPEDVAIFDPFFQTEYNIREEIQQVDVPFDPIVPRGKPRGYELDSVYGVDADALGAEFVALQAPSGGVVVQMLYYNEQGQLLRITESPSIFVTIGEWTATNRLEFQPGVDVWTTGGVDTVVVDQSGGAGSGPYLVAFIVRDRFMAIDGDAALESMLDMAARFASSFGAELPEPRIPLGGPFVRQVR